MTNQHDMNEIPVEKKFKVLCEIVRAQHFAWHEAVVQLCPDQDPAQVTDLMWQITGEQTAASYLKRLDPSKPLAPQIAASIAWSSLCMGEDAVVETSSDKEEAFVRHNDCPWWHWHKKTDLLAEDRPGCDIWFQTIIKMVNQKLETSVKIETMEALPEGGKCCLRRIWVEGLKE